MIERPILFSAPMVRAILAGTKTQTRRAVKPQPIAFWDAPSSHPELGLNAVVHDDGKPRDHWINCPYGAPRDRLWIKEAIRHLRGTLGCGVSEYVADGAITPTDAWPWKLQTLPAMFCPRGLSRITLEVTGVRVERLFDISEEDCRAEGILEGANGWMTDEGQPVSDTARRAYEDLWHSINGEWRDCWVWVIEFKRVP